MKYIFASILFLIATPAFAAQHQYTYTNNAITSTTTVMLQECDPDGVVYAGSNLCGYLIDGSYTVGDVTSGVSYSSLGIEVFKNNTATSTETFQWNSLSLSGYSSLTAQGFTFRLIRLLDYAIVSGNLVWKADVVRTVTPLLEGLDAECNGGATTCYGAIFSETIINDSPYGYMIVKNNAGNPYPSIGTDFCSTAYSSGAQANCTTAGFGSNVGQDFVVQNMTWDTAEQYLFNYHKVHVFDTAGYTPGGNFLRPPSEIDVQACNDGEASTLGNILCTAFDLLLRPSEGALGYAETTFDVIMLQFPFSYATDIRTIASTSMAFATSSLSIPILNINGTTTSYALFDNTVYNEWVSPLTQDTIRLAILYALWLGFIFSIYELVHRKETLS